MLTSSLKIISNSILIIIHKFICSIQYCANVVKLVRIKFCRQADGFLVRSYFQRVKMSLYNTIFKRTSTFALACGVSVFFFERTLDLASETLFEKVNQGVSIT